MIARRLFFAVATAIFCAIAGQGARAQTDVGPTLSQIIRRGYLNCGVTVAPGFAENSEEGGWRGFDVDFCRAVASAIFDNPEKVGFTALSPKERVAALQAGWVDFLASAAPWTQSRDGGQRVVYAGVALYDGQSFLVRRQRSFASAQDLANVSVCVQQGTSYELELADFFHARKIVYEPKPFATFEEATSAYDASQCDALASDATTLHAVRAKLTSPPDHAVLPDLLTKAPRGPVARQGDDQWLAILRWALFVMINAEELQVSMATADAALKSEDPRIRHLLGVEGDRSAGLALPGDWPYRIIKHVGNYADVFERNLGQASPLRMERRLNALWSKGGLMYVPPVR
jgi:general L-amino acid transport system substrate-binding protein